LSIPYFFCQKYRESWIFRAWKYKRKSKSFIVEHEKHFVIPIQHSDPLLMFACLPHFATQSFPDHSYAFVPLSLARIIQHFNSLLAMNISHSLFTTGQACKCGNHIGGVMVCVLASSELNIGFESQSGQTNDHTIGMCCFSVKHAALGRKSKDWFALNQDNVC
jgi:hypothetical protein